jgi:o-succinylbenzoate synthase
MSHPAGPPTTPTIAAHLPDEVRDFARDLDVDAVRMYSIPMTTRFRGITVREGLLLQGPAGWGEFCPFADYDDEVSAWWLATTLEAAVLGWPAPVRDRIPINATVPAVDAARAHAIVTVSGCATAKVKVADHPESLA